MMKNGTTPEALKKHWWKSSAKNREKGEVLVPKPEGEGKKTRGLLGFVV